MDCLALVDGKWACIDFKTSKSVYRESWAQVAAYARAAKEMGIVEYMPRGVVLRLAKNVEPEPFEYIQATPEELEDEHFKAFLAALELYWWAHDQYRKEKGI